MLINNNCVKSLKKWIIENFEQIDYRIAIPSYKREKAIKNKTLKLLKEKGINSDKIDVFVATEDEYNNYKYLLEEGLCKNVIIGELGMKEIRKFIQNYYPENQKLVCFDDDIENLFECYDSKNQKPIEDLNAFICYAFTLSKEIGAKLWGVYPVNNPFFMKNTISCGLRFLNGTMWGIINRKHPYFYLNIDDKEDYERSIKHYLVDKTVLRFDFISYKSKEFTEAGGMQFDGKRTLERNRQSVIYLTKKYPKLCKVNKARKDRWEVKLIEQREEYKPLANWKINIKK